jgi:hypothetical protein
LSTPLVIFRVAEVTPMLPACRRLQNEQLQRAASSYPFGASPVSSIAPQWQVAVIFIVS